jgi:hypothetical protein
MRRVTITDCLCMLDSLHLSSNLSLHTALWRGQGVHRTQCFDIGDSDTVIDTHGTQPYASRDVRQRWIQACHVPASVAVVTEQHGVTIVSEATYLTGERGVWTKKAGVQGDINVGQVTGCEVSNVVDHDTSTFALQSHNTIVTNLFDTIDCRLSSHLQGVADITMPKVHKITRAVCAQRGHVTA